MSLDDPTMYCPSCGSAMTKRMAASDMRIYYTCTLCCHRWYTMRLEAVA